MGAIVSDLKFAVRTLSRSPLFTTVAILSLALGIGANTAIFTLLDQLLLRLLPVKDPEQLVMIYSRGNHSGNNRGSRASSYPMYQDFQAKATPFSEVFARFRFQASVAVDNSTELLNGEMVSGNYFNALGVGPAAGRVFSSGEDDRVYKGHPVAVISHDYWQRRFAGDPTIVGKKILISNVPMTIVGVSAAGFTGLDPARSPSIRVPLQMKPVLTPGWDALGDRRSRWIQMFARLKPGQTPETAQGALTPLFKQILADEVTMPAFKDSSKFQRDRFLAMTVHVERAATGYSDIRNSFSNALIVLMCMVGLVLLIACSNVANLMIARAVARQKEIAVRLSLGATRGQLVRQLLIESVVLSLAGGVLGVLLATWTTRGLLSLLPSEGSPLTLRADPDLRILGFSIALAVLTGLLFGLAPAFKSTKVDLWSTLKDAVGSIAGGGQSLILRKGLVTAQVTLSFLLLFGAGLFIKSLQNLKGTDSGFDRPQNLISFQVDPALNGYSVQRIKLFYRELVDNIRAIPGVSGAGFAAVALLAGNEWDSTMGVAGYQHKDGEDMQAFMNSISPGYFKTMGVPIIEGRDFDGRESGERSTVAVVNRKFAKHFFGDKPAVGHRIGFGTGPNNKYEIEIIGVAEDTLYEGPREGVRRQVFISQNQSGFPGSAVFYVRTNQESRAMASALLSQVKKQDAALPVFQMKTLERQLDETLLTERLIAMLATAFGGLATLLASIGLYGVMAFIVARRTKEIGVRMALGAQQGTVVWLVMKEVLLLVAIGLAIGLPAALVAGTFVKNQLYGMEANDPTIATLSVLLLAGVAALAGFLPARRASRVDPILALRYE